MQNLRLINPHKLKEFIRNNEPFLKEQEKNQKKVGREGNQG